MNAPHWEPTPHPLDVAPLYHQGGRDHYTAHAAPRKGVISSIESVSASGMRVHLMVDMIPGQTLAPGDVIVTGPMPRPPKHQPLAASDWSDPGRSIT